MTLKTEESAIRRGIKTVGVGKKGSKSLDAGLAREILDDLKAGRVPDAAKGAFFAGLLNKGLSPEERPLSDAFPPGVLEDPVRLAETLASDAPDFAKDACVALVRGKSLDAPAAYRLGQFLFSDAPGHTARGFIASYLRVRYESDDEYAGILKAAQETIRPEFQRPIPSGKPVIQLAEPFDGVDHSYMITPLVGTFLQKSGYRSVHLVGRNGGPKLVFNLQDIAKGLNAAFCKNSDDLAGPAPVFGWFLSQQDLSPALDAWVELRHQTIKRPFLATLERFLNPVQADVLAASAFHPPYGEKMLTIAERAGYPGAIIIRNGMEGTMAFPLKREVRILCSARQAGGHYQRHEILFDPEKFLGEALPMDEKLESPSLPENVRLTREFADNGKTANRLFDLRVKTTCEGFRLAIEWLSQSTQR
ncbi:MAG: hypothetical protein Q8Q08_08910 [Candidatus Omnitrophota bacterium]|nr:hypothetical protein [Candidatus Omnitrophota bacterium]MDZ4242641.1 hypothetical protein [Candidatus Omnitrophota bacterium]